MFDTITVLIEILNISEHSESSVYWSILFERSSLFNVAIWGTCHGHPFHLPSAVFFYESIESQLSNRKINGRPLCVPISSAVLHISTKLTLSVGGMQFISGRKRGAFTQNTAAVFRHECRELNVWLFDEGRQRLWYKKRVKLWVDTRPRHALFGIICSIRFVKPLRGLKHYLPL